MNTIIYICIVLKIQPGFYQKILYNNGSIPVYSNVYQEVFATVFTTMGDDIDRWVQCSAFRKNTCPV